MFLYLITAVVISVSIADVSATPPHATTPFICGEMPHTIYACLGNPKLIKADVSINCAQSASECDKMTCIFTKSGWLKDGKVDKSKVAAHYDQFATKHPEWSIPVQLANSACLSYDLPPQGVYLNCPAYDIALCFLSNFIKSAPPSQWSSDAQCEGPKQFAAVCPVCPGDCFAPRVPYGSCNACLALPRSP